MRVALGLGAAALLAGCGGGRSPITVAHYLQRCDALKGQLVSVAGYVGECSGYACVLYPDASGPAASHRHMSKTRTAVYRQRDGLPPDPAPIPPEPAQIGIGASPAFDRAARDLQNRYVVITGTVDRRSCTGIGGTDRASGIHPTNIRAWTSSEGAPKTIN